MAFFAFMPRIKLYIPNNTKSNQYLKKNMFSTISLVSLEHRHLFTYNKHLVSKTSLVSLLHGPFYFDSASTLCQPQPCASLNLVPTSTSCQPQPRASLNLVPAPTSCQPEPPCQPCPGCVRIFPPTLRRPTHAVAGSCPGLLWLTPRRPLKV